MIILSIFSPLSYHKPSFTRFLHIITTGNLEARGELAQGLVGVQKVHPRATRRSRVCAAGSAGSLLSPDLTPSVFPSGQRVRGACWWNSLCAVLEGSQPRLHNATPRGSAGTEGPCATPALSPTLPCAPSSPSVVDSQARGKHGASSGSWRQQRLHKGSGPQQEAAVPSLTRFSCR